MMHKSAPSVNVTPAKKEWSKPNLVKIGTIADVAGARAGTSEVGPDFNLSTS